MSDGMNIPPNKPGFIESHKTSIRVVSTGSILLGSEVAIAAIAATFALPVGLFVTLPIAVVLGGGLLALGAAGWIATARKTDRVAQDRFSEESSGLPPTTKPILPQRTRQEEETRLTSEQLEALKSFRDRNIDLFKQRKEPFVIRRDSDKLTTPIPRSILVVPQASGDPKVYVLLKRKKWENKRGSEIARGEFKSATLALDLDTLEKKVFLSDLKGKKVSDQEIEVVKHFKGRQGFVGGVVVKYPWKGGSTELKTGILVDYFDQGKLSSSLARLKPEDKFVIAHDIAKALKDMHQDRYIHRDLKPANILLKRDKGRLRAALADFGFATRAMVIIGFFHTDLAGSPWYMDPHVALKGDKGQQNYKSDVWAFGAILYDMQKAGSGVLGTELGYKMGRKEEDHKFWPGANTGARNLKEATEALDVWKQRSLPGKDDPTTLDYVIFRCLSIDPSRRWTMAQAEAHLARHIPSDAQ